jgi:uncharacterized protein YecE (DUF72 family)
MNAIFIDVPVDAVTTNRSSIEQNIGPFDTTSSLLHIHEGLERLRELVPNLDNRFRYAIEVRHSSWFQDLTYNFFANNDICLVWSHLAGLQTSPVVTTDFLYVRFIGDRSIEENDFGRIQIDRIPDKQKWAENIKNVQEHTNLAIVAANNHYAGFGRGTVNIFRNMIGLPEAKWEEKEMGIQAQV